MKLLLHTDHLLVVFSQDASRLPEQAEIAIAGMEGRIQVRLLERLTHPLFNGGEVFLDGREVFQVRVERGQPEPRARW